MTLSSDVIAKLSDQDGRPARRTARVEWPTLVIAGLIYGAWIAITLCHNQIGRASCRERV